MKVLMIPTKLGEVHVAKIGSGLTCMQELVGGYIECVTLPGLIEKGIMLVVNEEGLLSGLPVNENLWPFFYVGDCFMCGVHGEHFVSLTDAQLRYAISWLHGLV